MDEVKICPKCGMRFEGDMIKEGFTICPHCEEEVELVHLTRYIFDAKRKDYRDVKKEYKPSDFDKVVALIDSFAEHQKKYPDRTFKINVQFHQDAEPKIDYFRIRCMQNKELDQLLSDCYKDGCNNRFFMSCAKHLVLEGGGWTV